MAKFVHAQLYRKMIRKIVADFLEDTLRMLPYRADTLMMGNGVHFAKKVAPSVSLVVRLVISPKSNPEGAAWSTCATLF